MGIYVARSIRGLTFSIERAKSMIRREESKHFLHVFKDSGTIVGLWKFLRDCSSVRNSSDIGWDGDVDLLNSFFFVKDNNLSSDAKPMSELETICSDAFYFRCVTLG